MSQENKKHLVDCICKELGISLADLARELQITRSAINDWKRKGVDIPVEHCKYLDTRLKSVFSSISCVEMRPMDWNKYWPELAQQDQTNSKDAA